MDLQFDKLQGLHLLGAPLNCLVIDDDASV